MFIFCEPRYVRPFSVGCWNRVGKNVEPNRHLCTATTHKAQLSKHVFLADRQKYSTTHCMCIHSEALWIETTMCNGIEKGANSAAHGGENNSHRLWVWIAEVIGELILFCSLFDPIMLCEEAPSVDILLSTIRAIAQNLSKYNFQSSLDYTFFSLTSLHRILYEPAILCSTMDRRMSYYIHELTLVWIFA